MKLSIRDYRGIERADIELSDTVTLICGQNFAGKSSVAQALGALVSGKVPYGLAQKETGFLVRVGAQTSKLILERDNRIAELFLPSMTAPQGNCPVAASKFALGLAALPLIDEKKRPEELATYLQSEPSQKDLEAELKDAKVDPKRIQTTWQDIGQFGWDGAHQNAKETGARLKGQWQGVTGASFQPAKGANWLPDGWDVDLEGASDESLNGALAQAREELEAAVAVNAIDDAKRAELEELAGKHDAYVAALATADAARKAADEVVAKADSERAEAAKRFPTETQVTYACAHCGELNILRDGKLLKPDDKRPTKKDIDAASKVSEKYAKALKDAKEARDQAGREYWAASDRLTKAKHAQEELARCMEQPAVDIESARERVRMAEQRLRAFSDKTEADRIFVNVQSNQAIIDALAPTGLRKRKLVKALAAANAELETVAANAGWLPVKIEPDLSFTYGGRIYKLLSASEQFRVNVVLQAWCALHDGSELIVIDAADILDRDGRNGLFRLVSTINGARTVICMTCNEGDAPDLSAKKRGVTYWLTAGGAQRVGK